MFSRRSPLEHNRHIHSVNLRKPYHWAISVSHDEDGGFTPRVVIFNTDSISVTHGGGLQIVLIFVFV